MFEVKKEEISETEILYLYLTHNVYLTFATSENRNIKILLNKNISGTIINQLVCIVTYTKGKCMVTETVDGKLCKYIVSAIGEDDISEYADLPHISVQPIRNRKLFLTAFVDNTIGCLTISFLNGKKVNVFREIYVKNIEERFKLTNNVDEF